MSNRSDYTLRIRGAKGFNREIEFRSQIKEKSI